MPKLFFLLSTVLVAVLLAGPARAQQLNNDGFQRRNGQMQILRNGQPRPMLRDAHLPTGVLVTKDGFVVGPDGKRTELREGQGCDLKGNLVSVVATAHGLALSSPAKSKHRPARTAPAENQVRSLLDELLGRGGDDRDENDDKYEQKRGGEHARGRGKKWKAKWKKGRKGDD
ncbi:hypothetical protein LJY25_12665 [Hymenobacter sp. BT175]|uniref:DUF6799 domain-containing protein n=1 Tax=Hymenobacter translucens TaxID=2886507 RepID=UPI001D0DF32F|nr:DUF6799 domain-containing protein [Hymenobacter translucens]MCC2547300.1 hypothetical protein [Hymenobacter translucens]